MMNEGKKLSRKNLIISIVVVIAILFVICVPIIPTSVAYSETEPYERKAKYEVVSATLKEELEPFGRWFYHASIIVIKNIDAYGGTFEVTHYVYDVNGLYGIRVTNEYLGVGQTKTFRADFDTQFLQDIRGEYEVTAPTIIDQKVVTKSKTVYKSIIEMLIYG